MSKFTLVEWVDGVDVLLDALGVELAGIGVVEGWDDIVVTEGWTGLLRIYGCSEIRDFLRSCWGPSWTVAQ